MNTNRRLVIVVAVVVCIVLAVAGANDVARSNQFMVPTLELQEDILAIEEANAEDIWQAHEAVVARWDSAPIEDGAFIDIYQSQLVTEGDLSVENCPILVQKLAAYYICSNGTIEITWFGNRYSFPAPMGSRVSIMMDGYLWVNVYEGEERIAHYEFYDGEIYLP